MCKICDKCKSIVINRKCVRCDLKRKISVMVGYDEDHIEIDGQLSKRFLTDIQTNRMFKFSDDTNIIVYHRDNIWNIEILKEGNLFDKKIEFNENSKINSDVIIFKNGITNVINLGIVNKEALVNINYKTLKSLKKHFIKMCRVHEIENTSLEVYINELYKTWTDKRYYNMLNPPGHCGNVVEFLKSTGKTFNDYVEGRNVETYLLRGYII